MRTVHVCPIFAFGVSANICVAVRVVCAPGVAFVETKNTRSAPVIFPAASVPTVALIEVYFAAGKLSSEVNDNCVIEMVSEPVQIIRYTAEEFAGTIKSPVIGDTPDPPASVALNAVLFM